MPSSAQKSDVAASLSKLSLDGDKKSAKAKTKKPVVDSWEDEDLSSDEEEEEEAKPQNDGSKAPPPTPISPTHSPASHAFPSYGNTDPTGAPLPGGGGSDGGPRRPEKTDAVARRMIASALGVKVPKQTEEQKAYDRAVREKERKRREEEKAAEKRKQEETERAKAAIWED
ncbi:hypothetical protein CkaCkLH20_01086 [Colletotrichum karsti]|uniref:Ubiquitin-like protein smt3 n=1 Tax=Colletotrichum karsti TaxID=1095194 RepID=A0A9P6LQ95_9PEZI|nr:uncharacterized protein CkaCkLH20_01086 [Colletotrichum karsti]KAF9881940.1 hypothetical protein CkaCkLH20_01086 [Colletotrichum karsti]